MQVKSYRNYYFSSGSVAGEDYRTFERTCKRELKKMCAEHGFTLYSFHPSHYEWCAVLEKNGKYIYVSLSDVRYFNWYESILVRSMAHPTDWRGGSNNNVPWDEVMERADKILQFGW